MRIYSYRIVMMMSYLFWFLYTAVDVLGHRSIPCILFLLPLGVMLLAGIIKTQQKKAIIVPPYSSVLQQYKGMSIGLILFLTLYILYGKGLALNSLKASGIYLILYVTSGTLLLRSLAVENHYKPRKGFYQLQRMKLIGFYAACAALVFVKLPQFLITCFLKILQAVWDFIHRLFPYTKELHVVEKGQIYLEIGKNTPKVDYREELGKEYASRGVNMNLLGIAEQDSVPKNQSDDVYKALMIAIIVLTVIAAVIYVILVLRGKGKPGIETEVMEEREAINDAKPEVKVTRHTLDRDIQLRYYYLKFLKACRHKNVSWQAADTTTSMKMKYEKKVGRQEPGLKELTELYRSTRYDPKHNTSEQEVRRAKNLVDTFLR